MSVIVSKHPNRAVELLEYLSLIRYATYNANMLPSRQTRRTQSDVAGEPVNILEHALHSSNGSNKVKECEILVCS